MKLGVLALQGDFKEHIGSFSKLGIDTLEIRNPEELNHLNGLVIPGGESTTITKLIDIYGFRDAILKSGKRAGSSCGRPCFDKYCSIHKKYTLTNEPPAAKCSQILKSGKRKGQQCKNKAKTHGFCGIHIPKTINV